MEVKGKMINFGALWSLWDDLKCHSSFRTAVPATEGGREDRRKQKADVNDDDCDSDTCMSA